MIGAGGVIEAPDGYWPEIRRICTEREILFIQDEVICGFGRLGANFGCTRYGVEPDLITFAKGVTSGYLPLGGVIAGPMVKDFFWARARRRSGTASRTAATRPAARRAREPRHRRAREPDRPRRPSSSR